MMDQKVTTISRPQIPPLKAWPIMPAHGCVVSLARSAYTCASYESDAVAGLLNGWRSLVMPSVADLITWLRGDRHFTILNAVLGGGTAGSRKGTYGRIASS